ncbi:hypothetical protein HETIRDRAFT_444627 [Heterobasidion irregulare TC 32-1]|uniref:DNA2/NAM7 helicase-like C-terminal domain-containing protein n=1 Tax=Heterobasidion irregulare (strain TC 32-1) TaxID=747525 RepID=W4KDQ5_HETIT|nr:uncharacterized protein HETIRDRAFT_444627 [Heterobasidion irregulare TC 32-1]ETW83206.1 hypothetical protein HETIRDRAFT_444627 [Heterobasidion irregulare TC 32-1]
MAPRNVVTKQIHQNAVDEFHPIITVHSIHESDVNSEDIEFLLRVGAGNSPRSVGIAPAFSKSGGLLAIALSVDHLILIVHFYSPKPENGSRSARDLTGRGLIESDILCSDKLHIYAFDLGPIALLLHRNHQLHLTNGVDIQSAFPILSQSPLGAVKFAVGDLVPVNSENISIFFEEMIWDPKQLTDLAQRAWLASYVARLDSVQDFFYKAPKIDTKKFNEQQLAFMSKVASDSQQLNSKAATSVTHDSTAEWDRKKKKLQVKSERFQSRVMNGDQYKMLPEATMPFMDKLPESQAVRPLFKLKGIQPLSDNPWLQLIWDMSENVVWPESYLTPLPVSAEIPISLDPDRPMNSSQIVAVKDMLTPFPIIPITLIQGPPGTGKTTVIATYVLSAIAAGQKGIWLVAQSNVAVKNIAEKLAAVGFFNWRLIVSKDFHFDWHEHLYKQISRNLIPSSDFPRGPTQLGKTLDGSQVLLCTLSMLSNSRLRDVGFIRAVPLTTLIIDEASQIEIGDYVSIFTSFDTIRKVCFIGDDKQLPPYGQEEIQNLQSIFEKPHLQRNFLDTQYRMPPQIGSFISQEVYDNKLDSNPLHPVKSSTIACQFIDVEDGFEQHDGTSWKNLKEIEAIMLLAQRLQDEGRNFRIITPYDAQRSLIESALKEQGLQWADKCFNVDSFQGNEEDYIIISVVRSKDLGFLSNLRRTNVMLTRCKRGMYIASSKKFLDGKGASSLVGKMAAHFGESAWISWRDLVGGNF